MNNDALERLETKLAFLERAGVELEDEVYRQRKEIDELRARLGALASRIEASAAPAADGAPIHERPPHY